MSFIKLNNENVVNTKVSNYFKVAYKSNDNTTFISNDNLNSTSIVLTESLINREIIRDRVNIDESLLDEVKSIFNNIGNDFNRDGNNVGGILSQDFKYENFSNLKDSLISSPYNLTKDEIKKNNFKNYFKVDRYTNKIIINSKIKSKNETIKNTLYDYYSKGFVNKEYKNIEKGFCNFNSINFFSKKYDQNKLHSNCIIYSNQINNGKNDIDTSGSFYVNFWINSRKNTNNKRSCILHIPDVVSLYTSEFEKNFRFIASFGSNAKKLIIEENFANINFLQETKQNTNEIYLTSAEHFNYNHWYNIGINFIKTDDNEDTYTVIFYKDGERIESGSVLIDKEKELFNSFVCIGNIPYYYDDDNEVYKTDYDKIFTTFFGKNYTAENSLDGPYYAKDLNLGSTTAPDLDEVISTINSGNHGIYFEENINKSSSCHAELYDIKIYNQSLSEVNIQDHAESNLKNISEEKTNFNISLYLPCFYIPVYVKKIGLFNNSKSNINLCFQNFYNNIYANTCGGLDISTESFLVDFVNYKKPNIVINGNNQNNISINNNEDFLESIVNDTLDFSDIRIGTLSSEIITKKIDFLGKNNVENSLLRQNNFYKNNLLLPNDNGIPQISFKVVSEIMSSDINNYYSLDTNYFIDEIGHTKLYNINCYDILGDLNQYTLNNKTYDFYTQETVLGRYESLSYNILINGQNQFTVASKYKLADISKFIKLDDRIVDMSSIRSLSTSEITHISSLTNDFRLSYPITDSNPVIRDYNDPNIDLSNTDVLLEDEIIYRKLPLPYFDFCKYNNTLFNVVFNIPVQYYNSRIKPKSFKLSDSNILGTNGLSINLCDNGHGVLYRNDALTKIAEWNYVGHIFYDEGIANILNPFIFNFGLGQFDMDFYAKHTMHVNEINVPVLAGHSNVSHNKTYDSNLRQDESAFNSDEKFVYITDINIHDENLNIVAKAKMAHPIPKKNSDNVLIRLKMDF